MAIPSGYAEVITHGRQLYRTEFAVGPEQSAIYRKIHFTCNNQTLMGICVTPQCEIGKSRTLFHTFCQLIPFDLLLEFYLKKGGWHAEDLECVKEPDGKALERCKKFMQRFKDDFISNRTHRYHFLPGDGDIANSFVDFQVVQCIPHDILNSENKMAVLKSPWREQIPTRYSFYQARIGTPPLDDALVSNIFQSANLPLISQALQ